MRLPAIFLCLLLVSGCAATDLMKTAETPEQKYLAILVIFDTYDAAGLSIAQDPNTPETAKKALKAARTVARGALDLTDEAFRIYIDAAAILEEQGGQENMDKTIAAFQAFNGRLAFAIERVDNFVKIVGDI